MRVWIVLTCVLLIGIVLGVGLSLRGPAIVREYLPKSVSGGAERIEGQVVRKQRDGNRLLVKVTTDRGPMLVAFTQKVTDLDVLLDPGDTVTLLTSGYATFVDDPVLEGVKRKEASAPSAPPPPATAAGTPQPATR